MKSEVYSWRVSTDLKVRLEREARRRKISLPAALDLAAQEWLKKAVESNEDHEQRRIREAASKAIGAIIGAHPRASENVREIVRHRIRQQHGG